MKRIICFLTMIMMCGCLTGAVYATENAQDIIPVDKLVYAVQSHLVLAGDTVMDILPDPFMYKGKTYVPVRYTVAIFGGTVVYNGEDHSVTLSYRDKSIKRSLHDSFNIYDCAYLPVRDVVEGLGLDISWNDGILAITNSGTASKLTAEADKYKELLKYTGHFDIFEEEEYQKQEKKVTFSVEAGCYGEPFELELSTNLRNSTIYYTVDGSIPTTESLVYTKPILIFDRTNEPNVIANNRWVVESNFVAPTGIVRKGTVIRARAIDPNGLNTPVEVNTYFVGLDLAQHYKMKVFAISVPYDDMFDPQFGVYNFINSNTLSNKAECAAFLEVWDNNQRVVSQPIGIRLNGATSRHWQQKSLRIYARQNPEYVNGDKKSIKYDLFSGLVKDIHGEVVDKYKRVILRNGGDDWWEFYMKDAMVQAMCRPFNVDIQETENAVVFVNGEFFGFYRLRERFDDEYFQYRYDLNDEKDAAFFQIANDPNAPTLSEGTEEDLLDLNNKFNFILHNDMSVADRYSVAETYFDMGSFLDYYIANVFFENSDWHNNNVKLWRNKNPENGDMRYRFMISDEDCTMEDLGTIYKDAFGPKEPQVEPWTKRKPTGTLGYKLTKVGGLLNDVFNSLLENENFKIDFIRRYNDYLNTTLTTWNIKRHAESFFYGPIHIRDEQMARYPGSWQKSDINDIVAWAEKRPVLARTELENYFGLGSRANVTFKSNLEQGFLCVNSIQLLPGTAFGLNTPHDYTASYYKNIPIWFKAVPNYGYMLDYVLVNGQPWYDGAEYVINPQDGMVIEAVFKPAQ